MSFYSDKSERLLDESSRAIHSTMDLLDQSQARANKARDLKALSGWHGLAFTLETILIMLFLAISLAVLVGVVAGSHERGDKADALSNAVTLATTNAANGAELFAADPTAPIDEGFSIADDQGTITVTFYHERLGALAACGNDKVAAALEQVLGGDALDRGNVDAVTKDVCATLGDDTFAVTRRVTTDEEKAGTLYRAEILVTSEGRSLYSLKTASYVSERG